MNYLKIIYSKPSELKYILLNIEESFGLIDKVLIIESDITHTGESRKLDFNKYIDYFPERIKSLIHYLPLNLNGLSKNGINNSFNAHYNENLIRGFFTKLIDLNVNDIVFSVDSDEIIYRKYFNFYIKLLNNQVALNVFGKCFKLRMHQFFYRHDYLWVNKKFNSAIVCKAEYFLQKSFPAQWRDEGLCLPFFAGCHFSWCLGIEEMILKLNTYAHQPEYNHLADKKLLENAVKNKIYIFDEKEKFKIKLLNISINKRYYPQSIYKYLDQFK
jgi:hypothetical protein